MAGKKYWRLTALSVAGAGLELTELRLCGAAAPLDADAVFSCSEQPQAGALEVLRDGSTAQTCSFSAAQVAVPGFRFEWIFAEAVDVQQLRLGSSAASQAFPGACLLEASDDGLSWVVVADWTGILFPGPNAATDLALTALITEKVKLLLHCDGPDGGNAVVDASPLARVLVNAGATIRTAQSKFGGASLRLDGAEGHLYLPNQAELRLLGDFTLAAWVWIDPASSSSFNTVMSQRNGGSLGWGFFVGSEGTVLLQGNQGTISYILAPAGTVQKGVWQHIAAARKSGATRLFVNGVQRAMATEAECSWASDTSSPFCIGYQRATGTYPYVGYIDEILVSEQCLYQSEFAVPAAPYGSSSNLGGWPVKSDLFDAAVVLLGTPVLPHRVLGDRKEHSLDVEFGGQGHIFGTVACKGTPANVPLKRRVRLHRSRDGYLARETWSKADGSYEFREISTQYEWDVIAWDHEQQDFSTVANNQLAEVTP
ncbi:hypothetical protein COAQ111491_03150 [Comamonas aquatilis]|uniref:LamG domain-containing protein n=1 Tax=Comamonas aquatilis TaxID=1778406 RepID=UPI0039F13D74